jgi:hemophore-related protein
MVTLLWARPVVALGCLAVSLAVGVGVASAGPDLGPVINTTCNYSQVASALNAQSPAAAAQLSASPTAQALLRSFLDSSPDQRQQIVQELQSKPDTQPYIGLVQQVANTCNNY